MEANRRAPFGISLRQLREAAGLSQEQLAERAGLSLRGVSDLERGVRTTPRPETVRMLADGLDLNEKQRAELFAARNRSPVPTPIFFSHAPPCLPVPSTSFIGRVEEIEAITTILVNDRVRLLTLTGPGGVGKTRIAIETAHRLEHQFANGALFVDLSPVRKADLVIPAIADRLGIRGRGDLDIRDVLAVALQSRSMLLVLDNLEQVIDAATDIAWLLAACPGLTIIVTSRILMRVGAEHVMPIEPMTLPADRDVRSLEQSEAVSLFVARAHAADHRFSLDAANAADVAAVVTQLQGMPLAIELAATRIRFWSVSELLRRLQFQLPVLSGGARDAPDRHRTMRDTIIWSYNLMSPVEQAVFRTLSIFPDGCTLEAAVAILGVARRFSEEDALAAVELLLDGSILRRRVGTDGRIRFRMMQPVREFGLEKLVAAGEEHMARQAAHEAWCVPLARRIERGIAQPDAVSRLIQTGSEYQNMREHIVWLIQHELIQEALDISSSLAPLRTLRGHIDECGRELQLLLSHPKGQALNRERVRAQVWLGITWLNQADTGRAFSALQTGAAMAREINEPRYLALALLASGVAMRMAGDLDLAESLIREGTVIAVELDDKFGEARGAWNLGLILDARGDYDAAYEQIRESLELNMAIGNLWDVAFCKLHLGAMDLRAGKLDQAEALFIEAQQLLVELEDKRDLPDVFIKLADIDRRRGDPDAAALKLEHALSMARDIGNMLDMAHSYIRLARIARQRGDIDTSYGLTCSAIHWYERCGSIVDAVECLDNLANIALVSGDFARAAWCIGAVDGVLAKRGMSRREFVPGEHNDRVARVISLLGQEAWDRQYARGRSMTPDAILAEVKSSLSCRISAAPGSPFAGDIEWRAANRGA